MAARMGAFTALENSLTKFMYNTQLFTDKFDFFDLFLEFFRINLIDSIIPVAQSQSNQSPTLSKRIDSNHQSTRLEKEFNQLNQFYRKK